MCGMKGYDLSLIRERGTWDSTRTVGASFVHWASRRGKKIIQAPCPTRDRIHGKARFGWGWKAESKTRGRLGKVMAYVSKVTYNILA